jgi:hypothetical protein
MSSTPVKTRPCCEQCNTPRTYDQFIANHTFSKPPEQFEEDDVCAICQLPYGSENLAVQMVDIPLVILNIPGCRHVFGAACIKQMTSDPTTGRHQRCPLCRTDWWEEPDYYADDVNDNIKHTVSEAVARSWQTDYCTARYFLYEEYTYADAYPPLGLEELLSKIQLKRIIGGAVETEAIQKRIQELQGSHVISIAEIAYHPEKILVGPAHIQQLVDLFTFNNYYLRIPDIAHAIFRTLVSARGFRLGRMYCDAVGDGHKDRDASCLVTIENEWMEMFPKDERDWLRLILNVLWTADQVSSQDAA